MRRTPEKCICPLAWLGRRCVRCLIFEVCERGTEAPTLGPNVQTTADEFFEGQASRFAFVTRGSCHSPKWRCDGLGQEAKFENIAFFS